MQLIKEFFFFFSFLDESLKNLLVENREYKTRPTTEIRDSEDHAKAYNRGYLSPELIPRD